MMVAKGGMWEFDQVACITQMGNRGMMPYEEGTGAYGHIEEAYQLWHGSANLGGYFGKFVPVAS